LLPYFHCQHLDGVVVSIAGHETSDHWLALVIRPLAYVGKEYHPFMPSEVAVLI